MKMKKILVVLFCMLVLTVGLSAQDKNTEKNMSESTLMGGWTPYSCVISPEAKKVFDTALKGFVGVKYTPVAVATQVVSGKNYSFFCNRQIVYPDAPNEAVIVLIYAPLDKSPQLISIEPISPTEKLPTEKNKLESTLNGGWTPYSCCDTSPEAKKVFDTALKGLVGVKYTPVAVATQVVAGINYSFFCNRQIVYPDAPNEAVIVLIYAPLDKSPQLISIEPISPTEKLPTEKNKLESNLVPGGWTTYSCIIPEARTVFDTALSGLKGVSYTPVAVATQVVAGINYSFFCNAKIVYPDAPNEAAMILIYAPPNKPPQIISIKWIEH